MYMNVKTKRIAAIILIVLAILSATLGANIFSNEKTYLKTYNSIDKKTTTVMELATVTEGISLGLSFLPDDQGSQLAGEIAELGDIFLVILCILFTEKYMLSTIGMICFRLIFPISAVLKIIGMFWNDPKIKN